MRVPILLAALAASVALAVPAAWSASSPPQLTSFSVNSVHVNSTGLKLAVAGTINCSAKAHFHVWFWVYESDRGALAHGFLPSSKKTKSRAYKREETCTGSDKSWKTKVSAEGKHPARFAKGASQVCATVTVSHSRRYVMQSSCSNVTVG